MQNLVRVILRPTTAQVGCLIAVILAFYLTSIRDGHNWGGDFSQYILHAQNLLDDQPYTQIGVDSKPDSPLGPKGYPPAYSLLMVPILAIWGLSFVALKIQIVFYLGIGLFFLWLLLRNHLPPPWAIATLLFIALSPWMLKFSNNLLSDIPYFAASLAAIWSLERFFKNPPAISTMLWVALLLFTACLFRSVGTVLIIASFTYALFFKRSHLIFTCLASGIAICATLYVYQAFGSGGSYASQFTTDPSALLSAVERNASHLKRSVTQYLALYPSRNEQSWLYILINNTTLLAFIILSAWGCIQHLKKRSIALWDIYMAGYLTLLMIYPYPIRARYLIPIVPFVAIYAITGFRIVWIQIHPYVKAFSPPALTKWRIRQVRYFFPTLIYLPIFFAYWGYFSFYPASYGANILKDPDVAGLFEQVDGSRSNISGIFFWRPRVLRLFTGVRTAGFYNLNDVTWQQLTNYAKEYNISHIVLDAHNTKFNHLIEGHQKHVKPIYQNHTFSLYKLSDITDIASTTP